LGLGWRAAAACVWLAGSAVCCGSPLLARGAAESVPKPVLVYNPLVRIFWHGLEYDWLHAANLYPKIGTLYYRYPDRSEGVLAAIVVAVCGVIAGAAIAFARRTRTAVA
jgi:hypothetical protein